MKSFIAALFFTLSFSAFAESPIIIIGASFANGNTPIDDNLNGPLGGYSVGLGSYVSLGDALIRDRRLSGHVVNEAQAGATTFTRSSCNPACLTNAIWQGYDVQFTKALMRVTNPVTGDINAQFVLISFSNDCLHSDAFGVPMAQTAPCELAQMEEHADRMVALGQQIVAAGLTPIFLKSPRYDAFDMNKFKTVSGLAWVQSQADYEQMAQIRYDRISALVPQAVQLDVWKDYIPVEADGLHPNAKSVKKAAGVIARYVKKHGR